MKIEEVKTIKSIDELKSFILSNMEELYPKSVISDLISRIEYSDYPISYSPIESGSKKIQFDYLGENGLSDGRKCVINLDDNGKIGSITAIKEINKYNKCAKQKDCYIERNNNGIINIIEEEYIAYLVDRKDLGPEIRDVYDQSISVYDAAGLQMSEQYEHEAYEPRAYNQYEEVKPVSHSMLHGTKPIKGINSIVTTYERIAPDIVKTTSTSSELGKESKSSISFMRLRGERHSLASFRQSCDIYNEEQASSYIMTSEEFEARTSSDTDEVKKGLAEWFNISNSINL